MHFSHKAMFITPRLKKTGFIYLMWKLNVFKTKGLINGEKKNLGFEKELNFFLVLCFTEKIAKAFGKDLMQDFFIDAFMQE